ncbi:MAG: STAS domain-containing protein [Geminicoccaceae bacterium]
MKLDKETLGGVLVVRAEGDLTAATSAPLEELVRAEIAGGVRRIVIDLEGVRYVASAGLRVFMIAAKTIGPDGRLLLAGANAAVRQVLDMTGLSGIIGVYPTTAEAVAAA